VISLLSDKFKRLLNNERGSASVEFVALAIPLFIPLFIFMNSFASLSDGQDSLRTLAREAARGFVTSSNDEIAYGVAHEIVTQGALVLGYGDGYELESYRCILNAASDRASHLMQAFEYF
jgi:Flp pilus assembly protein TadG